MAAISLHNVTKRYGRGRQSVLALHELDLDVHDGELLVIVGPSGCGKTTVLRLIAGLDHSTSGEVRIAGRDVTGILPRYRDGGGVAMVFQDFPLYPHMTVRTNMAFPLRNRKVPRAEIDQRINATAQSLGITSHLDRHPRDLSGGERQRVALGRALVVNPACLLLDEPLSNLDVRCATMRKEIKLLHQRMKTTIVYVTHDQEEAMMLGDRIAVMSRGEIQQVGPPMEVYRRPANRFVAEFIGGDGANTMNFIDGKITEEDETMLFQSVHGLRFPLSDGQAVALKDHLTHDVTVGIRPTNLCLSNEDPSYGAWRMDVEIEMIESLGDQMNVHLRLCDANVVLVSRTPIGNDVKVGDRVAVSIDVDAMHLFEIGEYGRRFPDGR